MLLVGSAASSPATVITFDDLIGQALVPDGYGGITWGGDWIYYTEPQGPFNPHSSPARIYTSDASASFTFDSSVIYDGAWASGVLVPSVSVTFQLFLEGSLVATSAALVVTDIPAFLPSGYDGYIDQVIVQSNSPGQYVLDDITFTVPEPSTIVCLLGGIAALGLSRSRGRRRNRCAGSQRFSSRAARPPNHA
jgi:hypothetical protein